MTSITLGFSLDPPMAMRTRSARMARSLYTQQRIVGVVPGTMVYGIRVMFSISLSSHASRATSLRTLYFRCCTLVSNLRMEACLL